MPAAHATLLQNAARKTRASGGYPLFKGPCEESNRRVRDSESELRMMAQHALTLQISEFRRQLYLRQDSASMRRSIKLCGMLPQNPAAREFLVENLGGRFGPEAAKEIARSFFSIRKIRKKLEYFAYSQKETALTREARAGRIGQEAENLFSGFAGCDADGVLISAFRHALAAYLEKNQFLLSDLRC